MRTKEVLKKLTPAMEMWVSRLKDTYKQTDDYTKKNSVRDTMCAYLHGLMDAGFITDRERQILFCYMTV